MLAKPLPRSWLVHSITYFKKQSGRDGWGNPKKHEGLKIDRVRFDYNSTYSRTTEQNTISINGVIFVDAKHSNPIPEFVENSEIMFNRKRMVIHKVVICYHPESDQVHHYELEVV